MLLSEIKPVSSVRSLKVALVGNPNSGKSTLFNVLTGLNQKTANFPGVTVEKRTGRCNVKNTEGKVESFEIIDLPGSYSLYPKTPDEQISFSVLCDPQDDAKPDIVIVIAEGTNLKRNLFLCSQIIDLRIPVILAVNMMDIVNYKGIRIDFDNLSQELGIRIFPMIARTGVGVQELKQALTETVPLPDHEFLDVRQFAPTVVDQIKAIAPITSNYGAYQLANNIEFVSWFKNRQEKKQKIINVISDSGFDPVQQQAYETLERYKVISGIMSRHVRMEPVQKRPEWSKRLDNVLTHRVWGYIIFLVVLFMIFQAIFSWAQYPMDFIDDSFALFGSWLSSVLPSGILNDLLVNGILAGLAGIVIFIPQITLLFAFIVILEDTGYMARVSFIMDKLMTRYGLNGRSLIPLISGVACAVPSIMGTRTIQSWKQRIITIMVIPLMSCSARLPVYTLIISIIIPSSPISGFINPQGLALMSLYLLGFVAAIAAATFLKYIVKEKGRDFFVMELPLYRVPRWPDAGIAVIDKVKVFLFDAGKIIIAISIILWFLASQGYGDKFKSLNRQIEQATALQTNPVTLSALEAQRLEYSFAGQIGHLIEPAIAPLGFDWKIGIALITSFAAREVFVGTMSTIYSAGNESKTKMTVRDKMMAEINPTTGKPRYNAATGWSLMLFYAFALQCMSTIAVVKRETGGWKWPMIQLGYMSALAYMASFIAYHLLS
ncbi:MAG: ferrous iron transport protein B [Bacteroidia bacterium]|nr:ferrous iron transport protein B [Bacteroidia bacterium]